MSRVSPLVWMAISLSCWGLLFVIRLFRLSVHDPWHYGTTVAMSVTCSVAFGYNLCRLVQCMRKRRRNRRLAELYNERKEGR